MIKGVAIYTTAMIFSIALIYLSYGVVGGLAMFMFYVMLGLLASNKK